MPPKSVSRKGACSICHEVVQELKYHYDLCEPCHQDFVADEKEDDMAAEYPSESEELDYSSDDDVSSSQDPTVEDEVENLIEDSKRPALTRSVGVISSATPKSSSRKL